MSLHKAKNQEKHGALELMNIMIMYRCRVLLSSIKMIKREFTMKLSLNVSNCKEMMMMINGCCRLASAAGSCCRAEPDVQRCNRRAIARRCV